MEDLKDPAKRMEMEYATQFFGFPPESLVDTMIGDATAAVQDYLEVHVVVTFSVRRFSSCLGADLINLRRRNEEFLRTSHLT